MISLIRELIMVLKHSFGGALTSSLEGVLNMLPNEIIDITFLTDKVEIAGIGIPSFIIYLLFVSE